MAPSAYFHLLALVYSVALPLGLLIWWKKKTGARLWCFVVGALCFLLFAMGLEQILHSVCLLGDNAFSRALDASPAAYMLYAAFAAGIFEETGRLFGFKVLLRRQRERSCAVAYGIGHGGIEVLLVLGVSYLVYFLAECGIPFGTAEMTETILKTADAIPASTVFVAMFERVSAMLAQIGLSMLVFVAARQKGKRWLYPLAILLHAALDAPAALYQAGVIRSITLIEAAAFVTGLVILLLGRKALTGYPEPAAADEEGA
jgi:uncharacterized membrane protein YhfC